MLFLIILVLALASGFVFTWWVGCIIAFVAALLTGKTGRQAFWSGFFAIALVWLVLALFKSVPNDHILADRVAKMIGLPHWSLVLLITCLIGGLVGGMSALSGLLVKKAFADTKTKD
ncbi:hypothetical protein MUY27_06150 [Mucilaginibacter sp. RS28]|uniref:Uncharacterized protein n=1 Tax=Mucilaginibacter straminoryzae TaxID=2932774 RepID=A0A9X2BAY7_9SPHI|nr:hypothetical protein [Mucilaginibacter straminoryzae]MCJ8209282.1 hypothetical protein [Mucilaginibacter straminoryzae]